jgi:hypothetical protein
VPPTQHDLICSYVSPNKSHSLAHSSNRAFGASDISGGRLSTQHNSIQQHDKIRILTTACCMSLLIAGFTLTQVPGVAANLFRTFCGREARFSKHLVLCSFFCLCCHAILSCFLFGPEYHSRSYNPLTTLMTKKAEISFFFAAIGFCFYGVCEISSLPLVGASMIYLQWDMMIFGKIIWIALFGAS